MYQYGFTLRRVVDGDTVDGDIDLGFGVILKNERIRLEGIDAPESRTSDPVEKVFGLAAKKHLEELLDHNNIVLVSKEYDPRGKFGRVLGDFHCKGYPLTICEMMISEGYAAPYFGGNKELIEDTHLLNRERLIDEGKVTID